MCGKIEQHTVFIAILQHSMRSNYELIKDQPGFATIIFEKKSIRLEFEKKLDDLSTHLTTVLLFQNHLNYSKSNKEIGFELCHIIVKYIATLKNIDEYIV